MKGSKMPTLGNDLAERRKNSPYVQALNTAYGLFMDHSPCLAEDVDLDGFAIAIAKAILNGPSGAEIERLRAALLIARQWMPESPIEPLGKADLKTVNEALGWVPATENELGKQDADAG